ncbi:Retrovirus-related Pol polyprotein from transposon 17.6, partial [Trichinella nelsoni]
FFKQIIQYSELHPEDILLAVLRISTCVSPHRSQEFLPPLSRISTSVPPHINQEFLLPLLRISAFVSPRRSQCAPTNMSGWSVCKLLSRVPPTSFTDFVLCFSSMNSEPQAYKQLKVDESTEELLTLNKPGGLMKVCRLPFGVNVTLALFQRLMDSHLADIAGVKPYLDDILISGSTKEEHDERLKKVLQRLVKLGLRLKKEKCVLATDEVEFLGFRINARGIQPTHDKVKAIHAALRPTNRTELQAFLGLVNFYSCFMPRKSSSVLAHYNTKLTVTNGTEALVAYASRTLTTTERNYAQIDKEALEIVFGVKKFHQYLHGRHFTIVTDHKPLLELLKPHSPIPQTVSPRMLRWSLLLIRAHLLKHTNFDEKQWIFTRVKSGCRDAVYTNLEVSTILRTAPHAETCTADDCILYKMEKRNTLKRHAGEETKPVPQIYNEECSNASTSLESAGQFPTFKSVKSAMYRSRAKRFSPLPATRQQLDIPAHWRVTKSGRPFLLYNNEHNSRKIYGNWLDSLSGAWTEHLKLFLNGTSNCSPFIGSVRGCPSATNYHLRLQDCPYPCSAGMVSGSPLPKLLLSFLPSSSAEGGRSCIADQVPS